MKGEGASDEFFDPTSLQAQPSRSYRKPHPSALDGFLATTWKAKQRAPAWQKRTFA
jgi:hypothetical protein